MNEIAYIIFKISILIFGLSILIGCIKLAISDIKDTKKLLDRHKEIVEDFNKSIKTK